MRSTIFAIMGYVYMAKDHKSSIDMNKSILITYSIFQVFYFENLMGFSSNNKIIGFSVLTHFQLNFYNFLKTKLVYKIGLFFITYIYFGARFYFVLGESPFKYFEPEMYQTMYAFGSIIFMSILNHKNYIIFLLNKFKLTKAQEKQWLESLKNIPNGILIYNIFEN